MPVNFQKLLVKKTLEEIKTALDKNEDLPPEDLERKKALEIIKDQLRNILDKEEAEEILLKEKEYLENVKEEKKNELENYLPSGDTTPTSSEFIDDLPSDGPSYIDDLD